MKAKQLLTPILMPLLLLMGAHVVMSRTARAAVPVPVPVISEAANPAPESTGPARLVSQLAVTTPITGMAWLRQWGSAAYDESTAMAIDAGGNIYVSGDTRGDLGGPNAGENPLVWLAKYNSVGQQQWLRQWGSEDGGFTTAMAIDAGGNVYVSGATEVYPGGPNDPDPHWDIWLVKYNSDGQQQWLRQWGTDSVDTAYDLAIGADGNVYVSGFTGGDLGGPNSGGSDVWLAKYNSAGQQQWLWQWGFEDGGFTSDLTIDAGGFIYVGLAKYNSDGQQQWLRQWGGDQRDRFIDMAVDAGGSIYLTGYTLIDLGPDNRYYDIWLAKYNSDGQQVWLRQWGADKSHDYPTVMAIDAGGNIYISGRTYGNLGGANAGDSDVWLAKYNSAGQQQWLRQWGSDGYDGPSDMVIDTGGNIYIFGSAAGNIGGPNTGDLGMWLVKYNSDDQQQWLRQWGSDRGEKSVDLAIDTGGNIYVLGDTSGDLGGPNAGDYDIWLAKFAEAPPWTLMFYLDGDNDLDNTYPLIFNQLESAADNPNANVIVFWDNTGPDDTTYYEVQYDADPNNFAGYSEGVNAWGQGELDSGDPTTLSDFAVWAMNNYSSTHYALFLSNHGTGLTGGLFDDTSGSYMNLPEMKLALDTIYQQTGHKINVLHMDMCLMGMIEDSYQFRDYVDYYVANQDLMWSYDQPYADYVLGITALSTPEEAAVMFADAYADVGDDSSDYYTISVADIARLGEVVSATNELALALAVEMDTISDTLQGVANQVQRFNNEGGVNSTITITDTAVDLYHFAELVSIRLVTHANILTPANQVMALIENSYIITERHRSKPDYILDNSHGVSIFFPATPSGFYKVDCCDFAADTWWGVNWNPSGLLAASSEITITWGNMLVDYFQATQPDGPNDLTPPELVGRLLPQTGSPVYLPIILR